MGITLCSFRCLKQNPRGMPFRLMNVCVFFSEMIPEMPLVIRYPAHSLSPD